MAGLTPPPYLIMSEEIKTKWCKYGEHFAPLESFYLYHQGRHYSPSCKRHTIAQVEEYRKKNPDKVRAKRREWHLNNKEYANEYRRNFQRREPNAETVKRVGQLYREGLTVAQIGRRLVMAHPVIIGTLEKLGIERPKRRRPRSLNEAAFDTLTEESAYWIGFLMADGCVTDRVKGGASPIVSLTLSEVDRGHVARFREFLGSSHAITRNAGATRRGHTDRPSYQFKVASGRLALALKQYGVTPRKSLNAQVCGLEMNRDFWRGVVDGDGCVRATRYKGREYPNLSLAGSLPLMTQFHAFTIHHFPACPSKVRKHGPIYSLSLHGATAREMLGLLYSDCSVALDRKRAEAERLLSLPPTRRTKLKAPDIRRKAL